MKTPRILLALLPLALIAAASPDHDALGPIHFGSTQPTAQRALASLEAEFRLHNQTSLTAAVLRRQLLYSGLRAGAPQSKLAGKDGMLRLRVTLLRCEPKLNQIEIRELMGHATAEWDTAEREAWEQLRDICDSKFERPKGLVPGEFPTLESLPEVGFTPTDVWEYEGVKIEVGFTTFAVLGNSNFCRAMVTLRATNPATK